MTILRLLLGLLPASRLKNRLLNLSGRSWTVALSARIHPVILWHVGTLRIGESAYVGPGNAFREILLVDLGDGADIGQFNWFSAQAQYVQQSASDTTASLVLERNAAITSRHYFDCAGGVRLAELSVVAGVRSTVLTHYVDVHIWAQRGAPVVVGRGSMVMSNCVLVAGTTVPANSVVAAGATTAKDLDEPGKLYGGVPARVVGDLSDAEFVHRTTTEARLISRADAQAMIALARRQHAAVHDPQAGNTGASMRPLPSTAAM